MILPLAFLLKIDYFIINCVCPTWLVFIVQYTRTSKCISSQKNSQKKYLYRISDKEIKGCEFFHLFFFLLLHPLINFSYTFFPCKCETISVHLTAASGHLNYRNVECDTVQWHGMEIYSEKGKERKSEMDEIFVKCSIIMIGN